MASASVFPAFLPKEVNNIRDPFARSLAQRIERLPVQCSLVYKSICTKMVRVGLTTNGSELSFGVLELSSIKKVVVCVRIHTTILSSKSA